MTNRKPIAWLAGEIKTPPFSERARQESGFLLGRLQDGVTLAMPHARPMPSIGPGCLELRVKDAGAEWRIFCRIDPDAVIVLHVFSKKTAKTPVTVLDQCKARLARYDRESKGV